MTHLLQKDVQTPIISTTVKMANSVVFLDHGPGLRHSDDTPSSLHPAIAVDDAMLIIFRH